MSDFNSSMGIEKYAAENGVEALRELASGNRLRPDRRAAVSAWLKSRDEEERARIETDRHGELHAVAAAAVSASIEQVTEARRAADAAVKQAEYARQAVIISALAFAASIVAIIVSVAALSSGH